MPYAFVEDVAASWEHYRRYAAVLDGAPPPGLVLHAAGPTDEGFRIIEVWESEEACRRHLGVRPVPVAAEAPHVVAVVRELRPTHVVVGGARATAHEASTTGGREP